MKTIEEVLEGFESKVGADELWEKLMNLPDADLRGVFCSLYGTYRASSQNEWQGFRRHLELSL